MNRRLRFGVGVCCAVAGVLSVSAPAHSVVTPFLRFKGSTGLILDTRNVGGGFNWGFGSELSAALKTSPLNSTRAEYYDDGFRTEAYVFAIDPAERRATFESVPFGQQVSINPNLWGQSYQRPRMPVAMAIPYPTVDVGIGSPPVSKNLATALFFDGFAPQGVAATPVASGSVKATRVFDRGECSLEKPIMPLLQRVEDELFVATANQVHQSQDCETELMRHWSSAGMYLDHEPAFGTKDVRGGFFLLFDYEIYNLPFGLTIDMFYTTHHELRLTKAGDKLKNGTIVGAGVLTTTSEVDYYSVSGPAASTVVADMQEGVSETFPDRFMAASFGEQVRNLWDYGGSVECGEIGNPDGACAGAAAALSAAMANGANFVGLTDKEVDQMEALLVAGEGDENFTCAHDASFSKNVCHFVLRAKRLNVYPNAVELVWFDGKELANPTYALWVAMHSDQLGDNPDLLLPQLCNWEPENQIYYRGFVRSQAGYDDSEDLTCDIELTTGGGGCAVGPQPPAVASWKAWVALLAAFGSLAVRRRRRA